MRKFYFILAIIGFMAPNIFVFQESVESGNLLLWLHPAATINGMFANKIATAFIIDLLVVVLIFFIWSNKEAKRYDISNVWIYWILTVLFGMAGTFPLFLYMIERKRSKKTNHEKRSSRRHTSHSF